MQIAFVHPDYPEGNGTGATHSATQIVDALRARGHEVTVFCTTDPGDEASCDALVETDGFPPHTRTALARGIMAREAQFREYDVLHSYLTASIPALDRLSGVRTVATLNSYAGVCPKDDLRYMNDQPCTDNGLLRCTRCSLATSGGSDEYGRLYRSVSRLANLRLISGIEPESVDIDGFQALSTHVKETYEAFGFPGDRIAVVPNIVDESFLVDHRSDFADPYDLLYVGYLQSHKGVDRLPELLDRLRTESDAEFRLTVVGEGERRSAMEGEFERRGLSGAVTFQGYVPNDELPDVYATHDLFVYPGIWDEPFGRVFLEALAAGTPVVGTDVGAVGKIVDGGGVVVDGGTGDLATTVLEIVESGTLDNYSAAAKAAVQAYRSTPIVKQFEGLYEQAVAE